MSQQLLKLHGKIQPYAWGGYTYIPELLGVDYPVNKPAAEYWMGAHPSASSLVEIDGQEQPLFKLIENDPETFIGKATEEKFGELPYLLKVLDVKDMLSIQVHPTRENAIKGYAAEEAAGVHIGAPHRNYKDKNHKPEIMVALSEFWLLHGFKPVDQLEQTLLAVPELAYLSPIFKTDGYYGLYKTVMEYKQETVNEVLMPLVKRVLAQGEVSDKSLPEFWVAKLFESGESIGDIDRGVFSIYFFNIVEVHPGEAVFQGAGVPHAYLLGQNVELMANSDNVLRGGLTPKHVDVPELLAHIQFEGIHPNVLKGDAVSEVEKNYPCPVDDFAISAIQLSKGQIYTHESVSAEIYLVIDGEVLGEGTGFTKGEAFFVQPGASFTLTGNDVASTMYKAFLL